MKTALALLIVSAAMPFSMPVAAQEVITETLGAATAFDAGALSVQDISLPSSLWQGTSVERAAELIARAPVQSQDPLVRGMIRAALLSGGVPPQGDREAFEAARLSAVMRLGDQDALKTFMTRNPALAQSPQARVNAALSTGDSEAACRVSDEITTGRAEPEWARLRTVCHVLRDEIPAAELTRDLLQSSDYDDPSFFKLLNIIMGSKAAPPASQPTDDALINFLRARLSGAADKSLAQDSAQPPEKRLEAVWDNLGELGLDGVMSVMSDLAFDPDDIAASSSFDIDSALGNSGPRGTAQLFLLAKNNSAKAIAALTRRSPKNTAAIMDMFGPQISAIPANEQGEANLALFAEAAVMRRDIGTLQDMYLSLEGYPQQARIALAADALGNGFAGGQPGSDIDKRLDAAEPRAKRDAVIAMALGASASPAVTKAIAGQSFSHGRALKQGDLILLRGAVNSGSLAEALLMAAPLIDGRKLKTDDLATVIEILREFGQAELAGQLAARDFLTGL